MSIFHSKSVTIPDDPAAISSGMVVPSHWNEPHIVEIDGTTIHTHSNKTDLDAFNPANFMASNMGSNFQSTGPYLTTAAEINHTHDYQSTGAYLTTAQPPGDYLTTAAQSNHSHNEYLTTAQPVGNYLTTAAESVHTHDYQSTGAYLTTAAQSNHSHGLATTTTNGSQIVVAGTNSNGATLAVPPFLTAAAGGGNTLTLSGSNGSLQTNGVTVVGSNGISAYTTGGNSFVVAMPNQTDLTNHAHPYSNATTAVSSRVIQVAAGTGTLSGSLTLTGSNGISVYNVGNEIRISLQDIHHLDGFNASGNNNGTGFSALTSGTLGMNFAGAISGSQNGNNLTVSVPAQSTQTQNMVSINGGTGARSLAVGSSLSSSVNGASTTIGLNSNHGFLTTAAQSNQVVNSFNGGTGARSLDVGTNLSSSVNGASSTIGMASNWSTTIMPLGNSSAYQTATLSTALMPLGYSSGFQTATLSNTFARTADVASSALSNTFSPRSNVVGVGNVSTVSTAGSLITGSAGSNGVTLGVPAWLTAAGGVVNQTGPNFAFGGSTVTQGTVLFTNTGAGNIVFGGATGAGGGTITASFSQTAGGGAATIGGWEVFEANGASSASSLAQRVVYLQKMVPEENYSFNNFELKMSNSMVTTSLASAAVSYTLHYGLYSLDSNNSYQQISTSSMFMAGSNSSSNSMGITVSQGAASFTSNASTATIAPLLSGYKHLYLPFASTLTAGGSYAFAIMASSTTTGGTGALRLAIVHQTIVNNITVGKIYGSTVLASNSTYVGDYAMGAYSTTTNALPAAVAKSQMTNAPYQARLLLQLEV